MEGKNVVIFPVEVMTHLPSPTPNHDVSMEEAAVTTINGTNQLHAVAPIIPQLVIKLLPER